MTFLEAAIEILQGSEDPLHISEITRLAVERKLLSHVGRDPEAAMRSCLNTAVRSKVHDGLVMRSKPGHYRLRPGVELPELPDPPSEAEPLPEPEVTSEADAGGSKKSKSGKKKASNTKKKASKSSGGDSSKKTRDKSSSKTKKSSAKKKTKAKAKTTAKAKTKTNEAAEDAASESAKAEADDTHEADDDADAKSSVDANGTPSAAGLPPAELDPSKVRFRGPEGSGLEGETDVALVMANAMSRLVDERPELREELEAMQKPQAPEVEVIEVGRKRRRDDDSRDERNSDERGGRRRRRRRRRNRRVEWSNPNVRREEDQGVILLDKVAAVLSEAGSRSLHVRQIAENLAAQGVLGGEISEIERAVTAAVLLDVHQRKGASRFAVRGDARYQLRGNRLPEKAASAEHAFRTAARQLESETETQLLMWLQSLGARSLEALVRIWLAREKFNLVATLPPSRGLGKLIAEDPDPDEDDGGRTLVLIFPRKTSLEPKLWDGEAERNGCVQTLVFAMSEPTEEVPNDTRALFARDFVRWLLEQGIGVRQLTIEVPVLDANLIESIGGLDT